MLSVFLLVTILSQAFFPLVISNLMSFSFFAARHSFERLKVQKVQDIKYKTFLAIYL